MSRLVSIDYGLKRVGIAVTDPLRIIVTPLVTVGSSEVIPFLREYLKKENVKLLVVGMPNNLNGKESAMAAHVSKFVELLKKTFPTTTVKTHDERFTSSIAFGSMVQHGFKKKQRARKENIDMISAAIILNSFIDSEKNNI